MTVKKKYLIGAICFALLIISIFFLITYYVDNGYFITNEIKKNPVNERISKIISKIQPKLDPEVCNIIAKSIIKYSKQYQLPPELIICIIEQESTFRLTLTSSANCKGLMQINPSSHPEKLKKLKIKNGSIFYIDNNVQLGCMIMKEYYDKTKDIEKALTRYVGGSNQKYVNAILSRFASIIIDGKEKVMGGTKVDEKNQMK